jgi:DNA-binding GntR family transcriptional regulator
MTGPSRVPPPRAPRVDLPALTPLPTAAERAAELIREYIFNGEFMPGTQLPETALADALQVSRNTVRDAFRMLMNEHLLSYEMHRGVSVRSLSADDLHDIYRLRQMVELSAIDALASAEGSVDLSGLLKAVTSGEQAEKDRQWQEVGTQNLRFHAEMVAVLDSQRADQFFKQLMTELRLGFLAIADAESLHRPYLSRNRALLGLLDAGRYAEAREELSNYLHEAEQHLVAAVD